MQKAVKVSLRGKTWTNGQNIYDFEKEIDHRGPSAIYMYMTIKVKQIYWYISISDLR